MSADQKVVLLVDDDRHLLITLEDFLTFEGFVVHKATTGEDALRVIRQQAPDIMVLDIGMPGMGGLGVFKAMTGDDGRSRIPVVILTARAAMRDFFKDIKADAFLAKPCSGIELARAIRAVLEERQSQRQSRTGPIGRVLLVENDMSEAARIRSVFMDSGYEVDVIPRALDLFHQARLRRPDVLLLKEMMPEMRGSALAAMARGHPATAGVPTVLFDPSHFIEAHGGLPASADLVLVNADEKELLSAVRGMLRNANA